MEKYIPLMVLASVAVTAVIGLLFSAQGTVTGQAQAFYLCDDGFITIDLKYLKNLPETYHCRPTGTIHPIGPERYPEYCCRKA